MNNSNEDEFYEVNISPINSKTFSSFFDDDFRLVKEHEFRRAVFRSKIDFKMNKYFVSP